MKLGIGIALGVVAVALVAFAILKPNPSPPSPPPAYRNTCFDNIKVTTMSLQIYSGDWDDHFPSRDAWIDDTLVYSRSSATYHCPTAEGEWGYAFNAALDRAKIPAKPESVPLVYDSSNPTKDASDRFKSLSVPPRHGQVNTVAFADGHAVRLESPIGLEARESDRVSK